LAGFQPRINSFHRGGTLKILRDGWGFFAIGEVKWRKSSRRVYRGVLRPFSKGKKFGPDGWFVVYKGSQVLF
jgi:hypothetical protein